MNYDYGIKPVLAHIERYPAFMDDADLLDEYIPEDKVSEDKIANGRRAVARMRSILSDDAFRNSKAEASWRPRLRRSQLPAGSAVVILLRLLDLMRNRGKLL